MATIGVGTLLTFFVYLSSPSTSLAERIISCMERVVTSPTESFSLEAEQHAFYFALRSVGSMNLLDVLQAAVPKFASFPIPCTVLFSFPAMFEFVSVPAFFS